MLRQRHDAWTPLQVTPDEDNENEVYDGIEIDLVIGKIGKGHPAGIGPGNHGAQRDGEIHAQVPGTQAGPGPLEKGPAGIQQCRSGECESDPVKQGVELAFVGTAVQRDGNPDEVHHGKAGKGDAEQQITGLLFQDAFGGFRVERRSCIADPGQ